jgi:hypothetical protein
MRDVLVVIGPGQIGQAIARREGVGKHALLTDVRIENATAAAETMSNAGYDVSVAKIDRFSRGSRRDERESMRMALELWFQPSLPCEVRAADVPVARLCRECVEQRQSVFIGLSRRIGLRRRRHEKD